MSILSIVTSQTGLVGVLPSLAYIYTTDTVATVTTTGYLNKEVASGVSFALPCLAVVSTKATPTSIPVAGVYNVVHSGENWSLAASSNDQIVLPSAQILVGNASNIATAVAMTGVIAITNAGVTSIVDGSIVNADINAAAAIAYSKLAALPSTQILVGSAGNVPTAVAVTGDVTVSNTGVTTIGAGAIDLAMLSAGITPSNIIKFAGEFTTAGGSATEAFTVTGASVATDRAYTQTTNNGTNNTTILEANVTDNTLTILFSGDPGSNASFNYQIIRATT